MSKTLLIAALTSTTYAATAQTVAAKTFFCTVESVCKCPQVSGCGPIEILFEEVKFDCNSPKTTFLITDRWRKTEIKSQSVDRDFKIEGSFREVRPYFSDLDWYQRTDADQTGVLNLRFDNEAREAPFTLTQMAEDHSNANIWTIEGTCEVIN